MLLDLSRRVTADEHSPHIVARQDPQSNDVRPAIDARAADEHRTHDGHHRADDSAEHFHVVSHATGKRHVLHDVLDLLGLLLVGLLAWVLWPASLGGSTHIIVVQGHSMEPVFQLGDAIVVKDNDDPQIGDIIVYRVPKNEPGAGSMIVHRISKIRDDGSFQTKGDNREYADQFHVRQEDIVGTPSWVLPHVGRMIGLASNPFVVGGCIGLLSLLILLPGKDDDEETDEETGEATGEATEGQTPAERAAAGGSPPARVVDPDKAARRRRAMAALVPGRSRRLMLQLPDVERVIHPAPVPDEPHTVRPAISPAVAARVRSLSEPITVEPMTLDGVEFDAYLASFGPGA